VKVAYGGEKKSGKARRTQTNFP